MAKQDGSALRVLLVEEDALEPRLLGGMFDDPSEAQVVRADSFLDARQRIRDGTVDLVVTDETRLRQVLNAVFAFIGVFSRDGVVVEVNQAPLTASGLPRHRVVGRPFVELPWFADSAPERARVTEAIRRAATGETVRLEVQVQRMAGGTVDVDAAFAPLRDGGGAITHVVGTGVDITKRRKAEKALTRSQAQLAEAQRVAHVGSWEWDISSNRVSWSDELFRIYGSDPTRFGGSYEAFLAQVHPDDAEHTKAVVMQARRNGTPFIYDHRIIRTDGETRMLHTRGEVVCEADGTPARLVGSCWDITDRWKATESLEHTVSTLRATLEATADGILVGDRKGTISALNQKFLALWRLSDDVKPGTDIRQLAASVRDQLQDPDRFVGRVTELYGQAELESFDVLRFKDGRTLERYSRPQRVGSDICGRVCSFRDVTQRELMLRRVEANEAELRSSADQLRALAARLDASREEERRLMAREIHDQIGQALTALKLDLAWIRTRLPDQPPGELAQRAQAMDQLIDGTLDTARRLSSTLRPALLDDLGLAATLKWQAREFEGRTGVRCAVDLTEDTDGAIAPDAALVMFRIVQEALTNVVRHAGARQVTIRTAVERATGGSVLVLSVSDDGRGITAEERARPTSLGLLGMQERALMLGGSVVVSGASGVGTVVTARVPASTRSS